MSVAVIGAGLAGCEAAWQLAIRGVRVELFEMKPKGRTPAHTSDFFAELCCSNSMRGDRLENAVGLLKEELRRCGSLILSCADATRVPAGGALAVDRDAFSKLVTERIKGHPLITVIEEEVSAIPARGRVIVASGPLTSDALAEDISRFFAGHPALSFYDAAAPLVSAESIDMTQAWAGARYGRGDADYINCPMDKDNYLEFVGELKTAKEAEVRGFEDKKVFEGCMPVEVLARRGEDALRYGPMRPVGLKDPRTGKGAYAVLQLRRDNAAGSVYNLVGFQTHLLFSEQKRVFSMIPALHGAEFLRYGVMHRNTFLDSPRLLDGRYRARNDERVWFAGQITGVEGYVESAASGFAAGIHAAREELGLDSADWPAETAIGAMAKYISNPAVLNFQPMNCNFALLPALENPPKSKQEKGRAVSERALRVLDGFLPEIMSF